MPKPTIRTELTEFKEEFKEFKSEMVEFKEDTRSFKKEMYEFKDEMYEFRAEMYGFRDEMYEFRDEMYEFKAEMYEFKDEMYEFKAEMYEFKTEMYEFREEFKKTNATVNQLAVAVVLLQEDVKEIKENMMTKADKDEIISIIQNLVGRSNKQEQEQSLQTHRIREHTNILDRHDTEIKNLQLLAAT